MRYLIATFFVLVMSFQSAAAEEWQIARHLFYEIQYTDENADELESIKSQLTSFHDSFCKSAGIDSEVVDSSDIKIELHPRDSRTVRVGYVSMVGGVYNNNGRRGYRGTIRMPGPAAYDGTRKSTSGHSKNRDFFDKLLIHEVSPLYLQLLAYSADSLFRGPSWFIQGVEEYFAVFHSTKYWRTKGYRVYHQRLAAKPETIDTDFGLNIRDPYNDGFIIFNFIREEFGEDAIFRLIKSTEKSFGKRLRSATQVEFADFARRFDTWKIKITQ